ncbi:perlucin-like protein isoform X2 [Zootermopsis nevadensis]|nr:perlucin-like protein isoform X2 [Zootermopsis nevadensis]
MTDGIWSPLLEDLAVSVISRDQKVMKNKPYFITRPEDTPAVGGKKEVTETDLYLLGAIEKLVYRVDFMEKRLRRTEELLYHVMANSNKNNEPCPTNFSRVGTYCYHFSERELNWKSSASMCRALGSRLAELETVEENQDVVAHMQATSTLRGKDFWTGGLNPGLLWIWSNSARPVASNYTENPSNNNNIKGNGRCLKLAYNPTLRGYEYQGSECSVRASYVCEHEENSTSRALERIQKSLQEKKILQ